MVESRQPLGAKPIADVVNQLREELSGLQDASMDEKLRFSVQEAEIELKAVVSEDENGKLSFNCWLFGAEGGGSNSSEQTQTIRLKLKPENQPGAEQSSGRGVDVLVESDSKSRD